MKTHERILQLLFILLLACSISPAIANHDDYVKYLKPLWGIDKADMNNPKENDSKDAKWYVESGSNQSHFFYVLLSGEVVVYCGITDDPARRVEEHHKIKQFDRMIAAGRLSEDKTRKLEAQCVCAYSPKLNKLPKCAGNYYGGGDNGAFKSRFEHNHEMYGLE